MQRSITGFGVDGEGDPFAVLDCGHRQHVRHRPPFTLRPWVMSEAGRREKLGALLECVLCDRFALPEGFTVYRRTPEFDEHSVPAGLLRDHTTRTGVWGRIVVRSGVLRYHVPPLVTVLDLVPGEPGIVVPQVAHRVEPRGAVQFHVEFLAAGGDARG